jgi:hypothetical protein
VARQHFLNHRRPGINQGLVLALEGHDDQVALAREIAGQVERAAVEIVRPN